MVNQSSYNQALTSPYAYNSLKKKSTSIKAYRTKSCPQKLITPKSIPKTNISRFYICLGKLPNGGGTCGAEAISSSTSTFLYRSYPLRSGMFVYLLKRQIFDFRTKLDKDRNTTYIHSTYKNKKKILKTDSSDTNKIITSQPEKVNTWQPPRTLE